MEWSVPLKNQYLSPVISRLFYRCVDLPNLILLAVTFFFLLGDLLNDLFMENSFITDSLAPGLGVSIQNDIYILNTLIVPLRRA